MKPFILFGSSIMIIAILISPLAFINKKDEIPEKHVEVVLRDLGHKLLLSAKDSSSRVLPVKKLNENTYQISFQNDFGFISDSDRKSTRLNSSHSQISYAVFCLKKKSITYN